MPIVSPSLLSADFYNLKPALEVVNQSDAEWLHLDVMDGVFVPNISFGLPVIKSIRPFCSKVFDVHLMIVRPERYIEAFKDAGAEWLTVHFEACTHLHRNLQVIKQHGMKAGVSLNPHTPVNMLQDIIREVDLVLLMSVNPGFGGQSFIPQTLEKVRELKRMIQNSGSNALIEVDGGVNAITGGHLVEAGVDALVAGSYIFKSTDPSQNIRILKNL